MACRAGIQYRPFSNIFEAEVDRLQKLVGRMTESRLRRVVVIHDYSVRFYYFLGGGQTSFGIIDIYFIISTGTYCVCPSLSEDRPEEDRPHQVSCDSALVEVGRHFLIQMLHMHAIVS